MRSAAALSRVNHTAVNEINLFFATFHATKLPEFNKPTLMRTVFAFLLVLFAAANLNAQVSNVKKDTVEVINDFKNLYHYQNYYISAQPAYETLQWLHSRGVHVIINLRSEKENTDFASGAFNEVNVCKEMGFEYYSVPIDGLKDYTPAKLDSLSVLLNRTDQVFLHCASGGRATDFFMAYLVKSKGYSVNEAAGIGRKLRFSLPLEKLLDAKIYLEVQK
jgi:protein tyrosine phosphatase (PTP) superfamily phosphohydrolase (DUF442 family)